MTTLTASDIATTSPPPKHIGTDSGRELEHFGRLLQAAESGERWTAWLTKILADPVSIEDDLITAPTAQAIHFAIDLLARMNPTYGSPDVVTLGPNGEIIFERRLGDDVMQIVIFDDLRVDRMVYRNGMLNERQVIAEPVPILAW